LQLHQSALAGRAEQQRARCSELLRSRAQIAQLQSDGYGDLPVCIAKTQYSFSTDAKLRGAPSGHVLTIREVRLSAGAGFVVMVCGDIMTMPGLPAVPAANGIDVNDAGQITGLS
jgi:formate--tetrahydrofolate ligase